MFAAGPQASAYCTTTVHVAPPFNVPPATQVPPAKLKVPLPLPVFAPRPIVNPVAATLALLVIVKVTVVDPFGAIGKFPYVGFEERMAPAGLTVRLADPTAVVPAALTAVTVQVPMPVPLVVTVKLPWSPEPEP